MRDQRGRWRPRIQVRRDGFWLVTWRHSFAYWSPRAWMPLSVRERRRWWGAFRLDRQKRHACISCCSVGGMDSRAACDAMQERTDQIVRARLNRMTQPDGTERRDRA